MKPILKSWTIRINGALLAVGAALLSFPDVVTQPQIESLLAILPPTVRHNVGTAVTVIAAINFLLRFKTSQPIVGGK